MDPLEINDEKGLLRKPGSGLQIKPDYSSLFIAVAQASQPPPLAKSCPAAALAFYHLVALLQQALALAILALLFFLDVGAFFIGHASLQTSAPESADLIDSLALTGGNTPAIRPPVCRQTGGPNCQLSLAVPGQILIAQVPVLP
jgi:hypothetical protein